MSTKTCRWCQEELKEAAVICRHCNRHQNKFWQLFGGNASGLVSSLVSFIMMVLAFVSFLEARQERIEASKANQETRKVANNVVKISHLLADGSGRRGGISPAHFTKIKEYQGEIKASLDPKINQQIKFAIEDVNRRI